MTRSRRQALGQHFLSQPALLQKIVRVIDPRPDEVILEVGPGRGALTALLAAEAGRVIAVEKDPRLIPGLEGLALPRTVIVPGDILTAEWGELLERFGRPLSKAKLAGNIPYVISSPLLAKLTERRSLFSRVVFLVQKEFALRLSSPPGSKDYSPLSILTQRFFAVRREFPVAAGSFSPPPRVDSEVVSLVPRPVPEEAVDDEKVYASLVRAAFGQRRKTLANNLESRGVHPDAIRIALQACGLPLCVRAEDVPARTFVRLYRELGSRDELWPVFGPASPAKGR